MFPLDTSFKLAVLQKFLNKQLGTTQLLLLSACTLSKLSYLLPYSQLLHVVSVNRHSRSVMIISQIQSSALHWLTTCTHLNMISDTHIPDHV